jgi:hypothetical protein
MLGLLLLAELEQRLRKEDVAPLEQYHSYSPP